MRFLLSEVDGRSARGSPRTAKTAQPTTLTVPEDVPFTHGFRACLLAKCGLEVEIVKKEESTDSGYAEDL